MAPTAPISAILAKHLACAAPNTHPDDIAYATAILDSLDPGTAAPCRTTVCPDCHDDLEPADPQPVAPPDLRLWGFEDHLLVDACLVVTCQGTRLDPYAVTGPEEVGPRDRRAPRTRTT
jgi:hypothetical protein